jgi:hypothetical protein
MRSALIIILCVAASPFAQCDQPGEFRLSEWRRVADLSMQYRAAIIEAIEAYRHDCVESRSWVVCTTVVDSRDTLVPSHAPVLQSSPAFLAEPLTLPSTIRAEDFGFTRQ